MKKLGLLVLRKNGLKYYDKVIQRIKVIESLNVVGTFYIYWKDSESFEKFKLVYPHVIDEVILKHLFTEGGTLMMAIAIIDIKPDPYKHSCTKCGKRTGAERLDNMNINRIKDDIRVQYGNIIHSADTEALAKKELMLFGVEEQIVQRLFNKDTQKVVERVYSDDDFVKVLSEGE